MEITQLAQRKSIRRIHKGVFLVKTGELIGVMVTLTGLVKERPQGAIYVKHDNPIYSRSMIRSPATEAPAPVFDIVSTGFKTQIIQVAGLGDVIAAVEDSIPRECSSVCLQVIFTVSCSSSINHGNRHDSRVWRLTYAFRDGFESGWTEITSIPIQACKSIASHAGDACRKRAIPRPRVFSARKERKALAEQVAKRLRDLEEKVDKLESANSSSLSVGHGGIFFPPRDEIDVLKEVRGDEI